ncbi:MAG: peptidyl-prolyl cis-trans isomerase [Alphaproteobacteria bacterium]
MKYMNVVSVVALMAFFSVGVRADAADPVVVKVGGSSLKASDLKKLHASAPDQIKALPFDKVFKSLRDQKVIEMILEGEKNKAGLANDPEVLKLKQEAIKSIEMQVFLKKAVEKRITDDKLKPLYDELMKKFKGQKESEISIIITDKKEEADKALQELNAGKNFGEVAKKFSKDANTAAQGGRLGFLLSAAVEQVLGADIGKAFKILKNNAHSRSIIAKGGKFILVHRGESRAATPPSFDDVKPQLKSMYFQKGLVEYLQDMIRTAGVSVFTADGKPDKFDMLSNKSDKA